MKRFEELTVGDFSGMETEEIAQKIELAQRTDLPPFTQAQVFAKAAELAAEFFNKNNRLNNESRID